MLFRSVTNKKGIGLFLLKIPPEVTEGIKPPMLPYVLKELPPCDWYFTLEGHRDFRQWIDRIDKWLKGKGDSLVLTWRDFWVDDVIYADGYQFCVKKGAEVLTERIYGQGSILAEIASQRPKTIRELIEEGYNKEVEMASTYYEVALCPNCLSNKHDTEITPRNDGSGTNYVKLTCVNCGTVISDSKQIEKELISKFPHKEGEMEMATYSEGDILMLRTVKGYDKIRIDELLTHFTPPAYAFSIMEGPGKGQGGTVPGHWLESFYRKRVISRWGKMEMAKKRKVRTKGLEITGYVPAEFTEDTIVGYWSKTGEPIFAEELSVWAYEILNDVIEEVSSGGEAKTTEMASRKRIPPKFELNQEKSPQTIQQLLQEQDIIRKKEEVKEDEAKNTADMLTH